MSARIVDGVFWFAAFLFSTTVHEAAHAWVALRGGDRTAYLGGQVSLSPLPHIRREPIGMLVVPLITALTQGWALGWASTPVNAAWADRHPRRAAWMAAAGPAGNYCIALVAFGLLQVGLATGFFVAPDHASFSHLVAPATPGSPLGGFFAQLLSVLLMLNVLLGTFNLLPLPPLDGASVIGLVLPDELAQRFHALTRIPGFSLVGLLVAWYGFPLVVGPIFSLVLRVLHPGHVYG